MADYGQNSNRRQWQIPKYGSDLKEVHTWFRQQIDDGVGYLEASPGYQQLEESIRILSGQPDDRLAEKQSKQNYSKVATNRLKRNLREMVNSLSEIRYNPAYHSNSSDTHDFASTLNRVGEYWYNEEFIDLQIKKAVQWAAISPCGWLEICYREIPGRRGKRVIDLIPMSWFDVVMTGVPDEGDHQQAYTVTIIKDLPMYQAHALFPEFQKDLRPDRESPKGWAERVKEKARQLVRDVFDPQPEKSTAKNPTVRVYYQYVLDLSINKTKSPMKMGYETNKDAVNGEAIERETPWSYEVPYVGQMIPTGLQDNNGQMGMRPAKAEDCRIFPGRRLLIGTDQKLMSDGPMWDWHGQVPLIKICADSWVFGDFSMVHDVAPIHETIQECDRVRHQTMRNRFNPTMGYNNRAIPRDKAKGVRLDVQGDRIGFNGQEATDITKAMGPLVPAAFNTIEGWIPEFIKYLQDAEDHQMGVRNFDALAKLKINAAGDSIDKTLEAAGPIVRGISRDMERSFRDLADMFKFYVLQYMTTPELMYIVGPEGITPTNFDYEPGNMIPSHLPWEKKEGKSVYSNMYRARWIAEHAKFVITPGTLHEITQTAHKMMIMQAWRQGFPVHWWKINEIFRMGLNLGPQPGKNDLEAWFEQQKMMLEFKAALSAEAQALAGDANQTNAPGLGPKGGQRGSGGRAASGATNPTPATKGDGRQIVKESN